MFGVTLMIHCGDDDDGVKWHVQPYWKDNKQTAELDTSWEV